MQKAYEASEKGRKGKTVLEDTNLIHLVNDCRIAFEGLKVDNPLFHAVKLVELDELETATHPSLVHIVEEFKHTFNDDVFGNDFEALIADARYKYISKHFHDVVVVDQKEKELREAKTKAKIEKASKKKFFFKKKKSAESIQNEAKLTISDKIDKVLTNRWLGIPIFLIILFVIFHLTFSEDLFYLNALGAVDVVSFGDAPDYVAGMFANGGINSPGVILMNLGFLPQILVLFLFFAILEDSGYMARVAFILDRIFRRFGLSGRAFMPMIMGFGCSVPAMINTRTLADEKERISTIRVIPFFSCGAKAPILTVFAYGIISVFGKAVGFNYADVVVYGMYVLGMVVALITVIIMRETTLRGKVPPFIMELPAYHLPQFKSLMIHLWDKTKHFVKKAFTIILLSTIIICFTSHFTWGWGFIDIESGNPEDVALISNSILASIGQFIQPIFTPLGFGSTLSSFGWVFAVAAINGLVAKENVISTLGTLALVLNPMFDAGEEVVEGLAAAELMIQTTGITLSGVIAFIAFNMLTIPCFAAIATAKGELPKGRFASTLIFWAVTSYVVSMIIFLIGNYVWTLAIFIPLIVVAAVLLVLWSKRQKAIENKEAR